MGKHTEGPWKAIKCGVYQDVPWRIDVPVHVASTGDDEYKGIGADQQIANAKLIAAAPDLLAALQWCLNTGRINYDTRIKGQNESWCDGVDKARAAIAKATA